MPKRKDRPAMPFDCECCKGMSGQTPINQCDKCRIAVCGPCMGLFSNPFNPIVGASGTCCTCRVKASRSKCRYRYRKTPIKPDYSKGK